MLGIHVTVPIACFRKGLAREYLETEPIPPPSTCYGFLLSLVGEQQRKRHVGVRIAPVLLGRPEQSVVLRTVWRCKDRNYWRDPTGKHHVVSMTKKARDAFLAWVESNDWAEPEFEVGLGAGGNARPDFQQLLSGIELVIWLDSSDEVHSEGPRLEERVKVALTDPASVQRFGGLSLGESTHLVNDVSLLYRVQDKLEQSNGQAFLTAEKGRLTMPVWVDHVGSAGTRYVTGDLVSHPAIQPPSMDRLARIHPEPVA